jgi:hypothetical protein
MTTTTMTTIGEQVRRRWVGVINPRWMVVISEAAADIGARTVQQRAKIPSTSVSKSPKTARGGEKATAAASRAAR